MLFLEEEGFPSHHFNVIPFPHLSAALSQVDHDPKKHVLRVWGDLTESGHALFPSLECLPVILEVFIPIKYDVQISTWHHGRVSVKVGVAEKLAGNTVIRPIDFFRKFGNRLRFCELRVSNAKASKW